MLLGLSYYCGYCCESDIPLLFKWRLTWIFVCCPFQKSNYLEFRVWRYLRLPAGEWVPKLPRVEECVDAIDEGLKERTWNPPINQSINQSNRIRNIRNSIFWGTTINKFKIFRICPNSCLFFRKFKPIYILRVIY